ncbi:uncharacterized protein [Pleurodeles waltl]
MSMKILLSAALLVACFGVIDADNAKDASFCDKRFSNVVLNKGYVTCSCKTGFLGNGFTCIPLAACPTTGCCPSGTMWDTAQNNCIDINECTSADLFMNKCVPSWGCTNFNGGYRCRPNYPDVQCPVGPCPPGMDCLNVEGSARCADPCFYYSLLDGTTRLSNTSSAGIFESDRNIYGWHRYTGSSGVWMQVGNVIGGLKCGSAKPFSLAASHPALGEGIKSVPLQMNLLDGSSLAIGSLLVKACPEDTVSNGFYIYQYTGQANTEVFCTDPSATPLTLLPTLQTTTTTTTTVTTTTLTPTPKPSTLSQSSPIPSPPSSSTSGFSTTKPSTPRSSTSNPSTTGYSTTKASTPKPSTSKSSTPGSSTTKPSTPKPSTPTPSTPSSSTTKPPTSKSSTPKLSTPGSSPTKPPTPRPSTARTSLTWFTLAKPSTARPSTPKPSTLISSPTKPSTPRASTPRSSAPGQTIPGPTVTIIQTDTESKIKAITDTTNVNGMLTIITTIKETTRTTTTVTVITREKTKKTTVLSISHFLTTLPIDTSVKANNQNKTEYTLQVNEAPTTDIEQWLTYCPLVQEPVLTTTTTDKNTLALAGRTITLTTTTTVSNQTTVQVDNPGASTCLLKH